MRKLAGSLVALMALLMAGTASVAAAPLQQSQEEKEAIFGDVVTVQDDNLVVRTREREVRIEITETTSHRTREGREDRRSTIRQGERIAAVVARNGERQVAESTMVIPQRGEVEHVVGVVTKDDDGKMFIIIQNGHPITLEFGLATSAPQPGTVATIVGRMDEQRDVLRAHDAQPVERTVQRLNNHLDEVEDITSERKAKIQHTVRVQHLLEKIGERQLHLVEGVLQHLPEEARPALERALRNLDEANEAVTRAFAHALELAGESREEHRGRDSREAYYLPKDVAPTFEELADALGVSPEALSKRLRNGESLDQIIEEAGLSREELEKRLLSDLRDRVRDLVEEERLTPEAAELLLEEARDRIDSLIRHAFSGDDGAKPELPFSLEDLAQILEMTPEELYAKFREGISLVEIAESQGVPKERLARALMELAEQRAKALIEAGAIEPKDAERLLQAIRKGIQEHLDNPDRKDRDPREKRSEIEESNIPFDLRIVARVLEMTPEELRSLLHDGHSLAEIAERRGVSQRTLVEALMTPMVEKLRAMAEEGNIDQERAEHLIQKTRERIHEHLTEFRVSDRDEGRPDHANERPYHNIPLTLNDVADAIGVPPGELRKWLAQGQGLGDIMREQGKDIEKAVATLLEMMKERLPVLVERGELSGEEARSILAELKERLMSDLSDHERVRSRPKTDRPIAYVPFDLEKVARTLDLTAQELRRLLSHGQTVAQIASEKGIRLESVEKTLLSSLEREIRDAVNNGRISEEEARQKLDDARETLLRALERFHLPDDEDERQREREEKLERKRRLREASIRVDAEGSEKRVREAGDEKPDASREETDKGEVIETDVEKETSSVGTTHEEASPETSESTTKEEGAVREGSATGSEESPASNDGTVTGEDTVQPTTTGDTTDEKPVREPDESETTSDTESVSRS